MILASDWSIAIILASDWLLMTFLTHLASLREAAAFLRRLSPGTFKQLLPQLPTDLFIESMPHSLPILEVRLESKTTRFIVYNHSN